VSWLCYPSCIRISSKFFYKNIIISWKNVGSWDYIHVYEPLQFIFFSQRVVFSFHFFSKTLYIFRHQIFLTQFLRIREMVHYLVFIQTYSRVWIENFLLNCIWQSPINVPLFTIPTSLPTPSLEVLNNNCFLKISSEFQFSACLNHLNYLKNQS